MIVLTSRAKGNPANGYDTMLLIILWILTFSSFITFNFVEGLIFIFCVFIIALCCLIYKVKGYKLRIAWRFILTVSVVAYLIYCFFNFRYLSGDGKLLYIQNTFLLTKKMFLTNTGHNYWPYLLELLLGKIEHNLSLNFVNLSFGLVSLGSLYTAYILLKEIGVPSHVARLSVFLLLFSPTFLAFAFYEYKVENFLLLFSNLAIILLIRSSKTPSLKYGLGAGLFGGLSVLVKVSYLPFFVLLFAGYLLSFNKKSFNMLFLGVMILFSFSFPLLLWDRLYGLNIPYIAENRVGILTVGKNRPDFSYKFDVNKAIVEECSNEMVSHSYSHYYQGGFITQPFLYFFRASFAGDVTYLHPSDKANPGVFLYLGFFLMPALLFKKRFLGLTAKRIWFFMVLSASVLFYIAINDVYWYIYPVYPFLALSFVVLFEKYTGCTSFRILLVSVSLFYFLYSTVPYFNSLDPATKFNGSKLKNSLDLQTQAFNEVKTNELVIHALTREDNLFIPTTFVEDYDEKIAYIPYYFAASNKSTYREMATELLDQNIRYVQAYRDALPKEAVYGECLAQNNKRLYTFLVSQTQETDSPILFRIVD